MFSTRLTPMITIGVLVQSVFGVSGLSAQAVQSDTIPQYEIAEVTVTATRAPVDRRSVPQRIDLVSAVDIARTGAGDVGEAIRATTALDAIAYPGLLTGVSIRGFRPQISGVNPRTLLLIDGRPAGTNNLALFDVGIVDRIEVLRGPASALYGSSAMGGVVNIITRRSAGGLHGSAGGGYGEFGQYEARLRAGGDLGHGLDFDLAAAALGRHEGYRTGSNRVLGAESLVKTLADGTTTTLPWVSPDSLIDFTDFRSTTGLGRLGWAFADGWRLDVKGEGYLGEDVENPGDLTPQNFDTRSLKDIERRSGEVLLAGNAGGLAPMLRVYSTLEAIDYYSAPVAPHFVNFRTPIRTWGVQAQNVVDLGASSLTVGADYTASTAESQAFTGDGVRGAPYAPNSAIRGVALFGQGTWTTLDSRLTVAGGARLDRIEFEILPTPELTDYELNTETHTVVSPNAGARLTVSPGFQLFGNVGRAFVAPEAFFIAGYSEQRAGIDRESVFVTRGNPELRPERSVTWDGGIALFRDERGFDAEVGYFHTQVEGRIGSSFSVPATPELTASGDTILSSTTFINADEATVQGVEGRLSFDLGTYFGADRSVRVFTNATRIIEARERFIGTGIDQRIRNVANLTAVAGIDYDSFELLAGRLSARYVGERVDTDYVAYWAPGEITYPAHLVLDLATRFRLGSRYHLALEVQNLTDEDYFEVRGYNQPGRRVSVGGEIEF